MKHKLLTKRNAFTLPLVLMLLLAFAPQSAMGADGANGEIDLDLTNVVENTLLSVRFHELDVSSDYTANWTDTSTYWTYKFTTGSSQNEMSIPIRIEMPTSGNTFIIMLQAQSDSTNITMHQLFVTPYDTYLDEDQFIDLGIPILIIVIFAGIIVTLIAGFKFKG